MKKFKIVFYLLLVAVITFIICYGVISFCTMEIDLRNWHVALRIITVFIVVCVTFSSFVNNVDDCNQRLE